MVYLREIIRNNRLHILQLNNIETVAYLHATNSISTLKEIEFDLSPEEGISLEGYSGGKVEKPVLNEIVSKESVKGIDITSNIFKLSGIYLLDRTMLQSKFEQKFNDCDLRDKYFLGKIETNLSERIIAEFKLQENNPYSVILSWIYHIGGTSDKTLNESLKKIIEDPIDVQTLLIIEDLEKVLLKTTLLNKEPEDLIRDICYNFPNAVKKINSNRRKNHPEYLIKDEYDVQDIMYVIIKSIFPNMRDEDPIEKVGGKSTKIDLILREEKILIEVKMIKEKDSNETHFIEQLKVDFESYHKCVWLNKLFCFVYDPFKKTRDISNFNDLNGDRRKGEHNYNVEVIVVN